MVFKLLKYDFKSMLRVFIPLWLALLAVSVINHFSVSATSSYADSLIWDMKAIAMLVFFGLIIAAGVLTAVLVIQRFYLGLLKDEGYLMFTLPVKPWQLLTSKVVSALVVCALSLGVGVLSVMILGYQMEDYQRMFSGLGTTIQTYPESFIALLVLGLAYAFAAITQIYVSLALGHLANRHRIAWAVGHQQLGPSAGDALGNLLPGFSGCGALQPVPVDYGWDIPGAGRHFLPGNGADSLQKAESGVIFMGSEAFGLPAFYAWDISPKKTGKILGCSKHSF